MNATETIWRSHQDKLSAFIHNRVPDDIADDILQDVFIKMHNGIDSLKDDTKLESWLYQITRNVIIDYFRTRRPTEELPDWIEQPSPDENDLIRKELSACIEPMIAHLPGKYKQAMRLSVIEGKTQKEIAELASITLSGAKSRVQRGRVLIKSMLNACCQIELNKKNQLVGYQRNKTDCKYC